MLHHWIRHIKKWLGEWRGVSPPVMLIYRKRGRVRLRLEELEDRLVPSIGTSTALVAAVNGSLVSNITYGTSVTLTATVTAQSGSAAPTLGSVDFVDIATNLDLGVVSIDTVAGSNAVFQLVTTASELQVLQTGGGVHALGATYTPGDGFNGSTAALVGGLAVNPAPLTITAVANTKTYDSTTSAAAVPTVSGLIGSDSVTGLSESYDSSDAATERTLSVNTNLVLAAPLTGLNSPDAVAVDGSGNVYVANFQGNTVSVFAPGATSPTATLTGLSSPNNLIVDGSGNLYVANRGNNTVSKFTSGATTPSATLTGLSGPGAMTFDSNGNLYVANAAAGPISKFAPGDTTPSATLSGVLNADALAFDNSGNLYAANFGTGTGNGTTVSKFAPGATTPTATLTGLNVPFALAFDSSGNLYVANSQGSTVSKFAPGATVPTATLTGLPGPKSLAFDGTGNLYVANSGTVYRVAPGASAPSAAINVSNGASNIAFDQNGTLFAAGVLNGNIVSRFDQPFQLSNRNNYTVTTVSASGVISQAPLTIAPTANTKNFDGTVSATALPTVSGLVGADSVSGQTEVYADPNVGTGKMLSVSAFTVNDLNLGRNYTVTTLTSPQGEIDPVSPITTQTVLQTSAASVVYGTLVTFTIVVTANGGIAPGSAGVTVDVTDNATHDLGNATFVSSSGSSSTYKLTTSAKTFNVTNPLAHVIAANFSDTNPFVPSSGTLTGGQTITPARLTIMAVPSVKTYDSTTTSASVPTVSGLIGQDSVTGSAEVYADKTAATGKTLSVSAYTVNDGNDGNNYTVTTAVFPLGVISKASLTLTATTNTKTYDSTTSAVAVPTVAGLKGADTVTNLAEVFSSPTAGTGKNLTVSAYTITDGNSGNNYNVVRVSNTSGLITKAALTVSGIVANNKVYDGTTAATLNTAGAVFGGLIGNDTTSVATSPAPVGVFTNLGPGTSIPVTVTGLTSTNSNYSVIQPTLAANITVPQGYISDSGTGQLTIALAASQTLTVVATSSGYKFTSNQIFAPFSLSDPANQGTAFAGFGTTTLNLSAAGIAQYTTGITINDAGSGTAVTFNDSGTNAYGNNFNIALTNAGAGAITFNGNSTFGAFNLQATTTHNIAVNAGAITSSSGNITLQANQQATPTTGNFNGISVANSSIQSTGTGIVTLQGKGGTTNGYGVYALNNASIIGGSGSTGTIVIGVSNTTGSFSSPSLNGVNLSASSIGSNGGSVQVIGNGGASTSTSSSGAYGVQLTSSSQISASGMGAISVQGTGGATPAGGDYGVFSNLSTIISSGGAVQVVGQGGGTGTTNSNYGVANNGIISAGGAGSVTIQGTGGAGKGNTNVGVAPGSVTTTGGNINIVGLGGGSASSSSGNNYGIYMVGGQVKAGGLGTVNFQGTGGAGGGQNTNDGGTETGVLIGTDLFISSTLNPTVTSSGGNVQITGWAGGSGTSGGNDGIRLAATGTVSAGGTGSVTLLGTGGATSGGGDYGVVLGVFSSIQSNWQLSGNQPGSIVTSNGGSVQVTGIGGGTGTGNDNVGVGVGQYCTISAGGNGVVTVQGTGGATGGSRNYGVYATTNNGIPAKITSTNGDVHINGTGGGSGSSSQGYGIEVENGTILSAEGTGNLFIHGIGGSGSGNSNIGVYTQNAAVGAVGSGRLSIEGEGGGNPTATGQNDSGVSLLSSRIQCGTGDLLIQGTGGTASGGTIAGVTCTSSIDSGGGNISIIGTGSNSASGSPNDGVDVLGYIHNWGSGKVTITGTAGNSPGGGNIGVRVAAIETTTGDITITGVGASGVPSSPSYGIFGQVFNTHPGLLYSDNGSNIDLRADSMQLTSIALTAGTKNVTLEPLTVGLPINLNAQYTTGTLSLGNYDFINPVIAGSLTIGNSHTGDITVSAPIAFPSATNLNLVTAGNIIFNPGSINTAGGSLNLVPGSTGSIQPLTAGTDVTSGSSNLTFAPGANLAIAINGTTPDTQYTQLSVAGNVNLTGANLVLSGNFTPAVGQAFTIVNNQGTKPITGVFNGLPEGAVIPNFLGSGLNATITYAGGDGNDVVIGIPGSFSKFVDTILGGNTVVAGSPFLFTVQAADQAGIPVIGYNGPTSMTTTLGPADPLGNFPVAGNLQNSSAGFGFFFGNLQTAGTYTLTTSGSGFSGSSSPFTVIPAGASYFTVAAPMAASTGGSFNVTVTAHDQYGNVETDYTGTVQLAGAAALGTPYTFTTGAGQDNGVHAFSVTLNTNGSQTITATDTTSTNPTIMGTSSPIAVSGLVVTAFTPTPTGFTASFSKAFIPNDLTLYGANKTTVQDVTLVGTHVGPIHGSLIIDPSDMSVTFKATASYLLELNGVGQSATVSAVLPDDTYKISLVSGAGGNGFIDELGAHMDGANNGGHANFTTSFMTQYQANATPVLGIPDFARGPDSNSPIKVPNDSANGIPLTLYSAANVTDVTFSLTYNPSLLNITGTLSGLPSDATDAAATLTLVSNAGGVATFHYTDANPQSATAMTPLVFGDIVAVVPSGAGAAALSLYQTKELLQLGSIVINQGTITGAVSANGVHVNAYFGDVTGDKAVDGLDKLSADNVAQGRATGFSAYVQLDPVIIGDVAGDLSVDAGDVSAFDSFVAQLHPAQIPQPPTQLLTTDPNYVNPNSIHSPNAADPTLSLTPGLTALGSPVVSVLIDHPDPEGSTGLTSVTLALTYDPTMLSVTPADISLGSIPSQGTGWQMTVVVDQTTGQIGIQLYSATPITVNELGSLVNIAFHVLPGAMVPSTFVQLVDTVTPDGQWFGTGVADSQGAMILSSGVNYRNSPGEKSIKPQLSPIWNRP